MRDEPGSPQEKKRLSYAKDRRNTYGENSKSSRKNIRRNRAIQSRRVRRALRSGLRDSDIGVTEPAAAARVRKSGWRKVPDEPLGTVLMRRSARAKSVGAPIPAAILAYNAALSAADRRICDTLAKAINAAIGAQDGAECRIWHRHPVWFLDGNPIVGYHRLKGAGGCIRLLFWSGQSFDEPKGSALVPDPAGTRFKTAAARFASARDISAGDLKRWLRKSIAIQWDYKNIVKRKGRLERLK